MMKRSVLIKGKGKGCSNVLVPSTFAPQSFGQHNICPTKFWSNATFAPRSFGAMQSLPRVVLRNIFRHQNNDKDYQTKSFFLKLSFVNL